MLALLFPVLILAVTSFAEKTPTRLPISELPAPFFPIHYTPATGPGQEARVEVLLAPRKAGPIRLPDLDRQIALMGDNSFSVRQQSNQEIVRALQRLLDQNTIQITRTWAAIRGFLEEKRRKERDPEIRRRLESIRSEIEAYAASFACSCQARCSNEATTREFSARLDGDRCEISGERYWMACFPEGEDCVDECPVPESASCRIVRNRPR